MPPFRLSCLVALSLAACGETITVSDDIDITWDFELTPFDRFDSELHVPYVRGTATTVHISSDHDDRRFGGWTVESSDPSVFELAATSHDEYSLKAPGTAMAEGVSVLTIRDASGDVRGRTEVEVLQPDEIVLEAHGYLIMDRDDEAPIEEARIVENGTATYHVRYFRGGRELHGNGVLSVATPVGITAEPRTSFLFENREWLTLQTTTPGTFSIDLAADGEAVEVRTVEVVPESAVADVAIIAESERGADDGDWLVLLAQAYDSAGRRIFGIDYDWMVDGTMQTESGDLYRYEFKDGADRNVMARIGNHSDSVTIHSEKGYVDSTNNIGCQAGGGAGLAAAAGMLGLRRKRRRSA
ncbi:MAG: hypothetical protein SFX73_35375 [Kofleriaceae bacterium]|nr:hypothetical protein [Kofleriaceae bacterium]